MDSTLDHALTAAERDVRGAETSLESTRKAIERGDFNAALVELRMGFYGRLREAGYEARGVVDRLVELGGVYPPPQ